MKQNIKKLWGDRANKLLKGLVVKKVEYLSKDEMAHEFDWWSNATIKITFTNGLTLVPSSDDEGNDAGAILTNAKELSVIPVIYEEMNKEEFADEQIKQMNNPLNGYTKEQKTKLLKKLGGNEK